MQRLSIVALIAVGLALGGCESSKNSYDPDKPIDKMTHEELCTYYTFFLTNPALSEQTRRIATAKKREKGCEG